MVVFLIIFSLLIIITALYVFLMLLITVKPKGREIMANDYAVQLKQVVGTATFPKRDLYEARDGAMLEYRLYPSLKNTDKTMILLHGAFENGDYLHNLAASIAERSLANVYVPFLRGYGSNEKIRDLDFIGQIDDDLADFIEFIKDQQPDPYLIMSGHGLGGSTALRFVSNSYADEVDAFFLLAPTLAPNAPTSRLGGELANGFVSFSTARQLGLMILNLLQVNRFNHLPVLVNNKPKEQRLVGELDALSFRMYHSRLANWQYEFDLRALKKPCLVVIGENDERYAANEYKSLFTKYNKAKVVVLPKLSHYGLIMSEKTLPELEDWLLKLPQRV